MAKFPGSRGKKAKRSAKVGKRTIIFGVAPGRRRVPGDPADGVKVRAPHSGVNLPDKRLLAKRLALDGFDDSVIARVAGVSEETLEYWKWQHPELSEAIETGRTAADAEVVATLFDLAVGGVRKVKEVHGKDADIVEYEKYFPPELGAIKAWLRMRGNRRFKEEPQKVELTGKGGKDLMPKESRADLINSIVAAVRPRPDNAPAPTKAAKTKR